MEQIKDELGSNAVLLHTKKYREGGVLGGEEMIEVTAAVDETQPRTPRASSAYVPPASPILPTNVVNQYRMNEQPMTDGGMMAGGSVPPAYDAYAQEVPSAYAAAQAVPAAPVYPQGQYPVQPAASVQSAPVYEYRCRPLPRNRMVPRSAFACSRMSLRR